MEIKTLTTLEELESLGSALTMEGLAEDSIPDYINWVKKLTPMKKEMAYIIKGKTMNEVYRLTGKNAYPDDCTIVSIKLEDMENWSAVVIPRFQIGARWFDDIVINNEAREQEKRFIEEKIKSTSGREYSLYPMGNEDVTIVFDWEFDKSDEERNTHIVYYFFGDHNDWNLVDVLDDYESMDRDEYQIKYGMK